MSSDLTVFSLYINVMALWAGLFYSGMWKEWRVAWQTRKASTKTNEPHRQDEASQGS